MHIRLRDWESNPGPLVHSAGEEPLRYLLPLNRLSRNETWCASDNHNNMCHICAKSIKIWTLMKQLFTKHQYLTKLPQYLTKLPQISSMVSVINGIQYFNFGGSLKYCIPIHYDTIKDGQNKKQNLIVFL